MGTKCGPIDVKNQVDIFGGSYNHLKSSRAIQNVFFRASMFKRIQENSVKDIYLPGKRVKIT